jgi:hypothetical protein
MQLSNTCLLAWNNYLRSLTIFFKSVKVYLQGGIDMTMGFLGYKEILLLVRDHIDMLNIRKIK